MKAAFERLVLRELDSLPAWVRGRLDNLAFVVEEESEEDLLGLFEGPSLLEREPGAMEAPARITLYRKEIEEEAGDASDIRRVVRETLAHEIGHFFGMTEEEIGRFEEKWAREAT